MRNTALVRRPVVDPLQAQGVQRAQDSQKWEPRRRSGRWGARQDQFCAPLGTRRRSLGGKAEGSPEPGPEPGPGRGPPEASPAQPPIPPPPLAGRGASTKDSNFRAGAGPPRQLGTQAQPAGRTRPGIARVAGSGRGWARPATQGGGPRWG